MPNPNELERQSIEENHVDIGVIIRYEEGELTDEETLDMFQKLVNNGLAWTLQGHYGRTAQALLDEGLIELAN